MQFSESWLRTFVNPPVSTAELSHLLTMAGLEVEEERKAAPPFTGVIVAQVLSVEQHPNADKLKVCQVDVGGAAPLNIVCGAPNVAAGMKVPCATVGAELPPAEGGDGKPFRIKLGKLRGIESHGMLCSGRELGISQDHAGLLPLDGSAPVGDDFRAYAGLDDTVFVIKLTPDKGHCLSVLGVAREVAAITGAPLVVPAIKPSVVSLNEILKVQVQDTDLCGRFSGRVIRGVNAHTPTPDWIKQRLERSGQRSISALVDISNYVMLELGRPTHVFDLDKIEGSLTVRWGKTGEQLKLLNGQTVDLDGSVGVITAASGVESLAGIMGGDATAVSLETRNVYVEAAFWWPDSIRGRARKFNFSTDAGHRFERGVDPATTVEHLERISSLILEICGGEAGPIDDQLPNVPKLASVSFRVDRARRVLGMAVTREQCIQVFERLGMIVDSSAEILSVQPPSYRFDIAIEEDLIEEVARIIGYETIPVRPPVAAQRMKPNAEGRRSLHQVRAQLAGLGYQEVVNYSFVEEGWERDFANNLQPIKLLNPIASQMSVMRSTLLGGLVQVLRYNLNRRADRAFVFEIGRGFKRDSAVAESVSTVAGIHQPMLVAGLAYGAAEPEQWGVRPARMVDFFDVKADVEALCCHLGTVQFEKCESPAMHPGRSARVMVNGRPAGLIGELHPRLQQTYELPFAPVLFELDAEILRAVAIPVPEEQSKFPEVRRDIAVVVDQNVAVQSLLDCQWRTASSSAHAGIVRNINLFDEYRGKGLLSNEKSLAFRLVLQDTESTLQDDRVDAVIAEILAALERELGARLRG
jgi:phenylalanyl-tRNA synthetase beta chain